MSRDFLIVFADQASAKRGEDVLASAVGDDGARLFEIDNRGNDLFVMLGYPSDVKQLSGYTVMGEHHTGLSEDCAFVAIKNGRHNGIGYFSDSGSPTPLKKARWPLSQLQDRILTALNLDEDQAKARIETRLTAYTKSH